MTVREIVKAASLDGGKRISDNHGIQWINEGLRLLALTYDTACTVSSTQQTIVATAGIGYALPADCMGIERVLDENGETVVKGYSVDNHLNIRFDYEGTYSITYLTMPSLASGATLDSTVPVHLAYLTPLASFLVAKSKIADGSEADAGIKAEQDMIRDAAAVDARLKRMSRNFNFTPRPRW